MGVQKLQQILQLQQVAFRIHIFQAEVHYIPVCAEERGDNARV